MPNDRGFILARDVRAAGLASALEASVANGTLTRVRRGVYRAPMPSDPKIPKSKRAALDYRLQVLAAAETLRAPIFTSYSAIALQRLPIIGAWPSAAYVLAPGSHGNHRKSTVRVARIGEVSTELVDGLLVTSIEHSLIQLCRHAPLGAALVAVDAALCSMPWQSTAPRTTIERLREEHERILPYAGSRRAEAVLQRATHLAATPLETCSRLVIEEFGFPEPELQYRLWLPESHRWAHLDFGWPEFGVGAEADGGGKYLGAESVEASAEVVVREKEREDELRPLLRAFERWNWNEMWGRDVLVKRLQRAGLPQKGLRLKLF